MDDSFGRFKRQFEEIDNGFVYRKDETGEAFAVSAEEHDAFVRGYVWSTVWLTLCVAIATIATIFLILLAEIAYQTAPLGLVELGLVVAAAVGAAMVLANRRMWNAPAKALARRAPVGRAKASDET